MKKNYITPASKNVELESVSTFFDTISIVKESLDENGDYTGVTDSGQIESNALDKTFNWRD